MFCSNCELFLVVKKKPIKVSGRETRRTLATCFKCRREVSSQNLRRHFRFHKVPAEEAEAELAKVYGRSKERILSECPHCHKLVKYDLKFLSLVHITESSFLSQVANIWIHKRAEHALAPTLPQEPLVSYSQHCFLLQVEKPIYFLFEFLIKNQVFFYNLINVKLCLFFQEVRDPIADDRHRRVIERYGGGLLGLEEASERKKKRFFQREEKDFREVTFNTICDLIFSNFKVDHGYRT